MNGVTSSSTFKFPLTSSTRVVRWSSVVQAARFSPAGRMPHLTSTALLDRTPSAGSMKWPRIQPRVSPVFLGVSAVPVSAHGRTVHSQVGRDDISCLRVFGSSCFACGTRAFGELEHVGAHRVVGAPSAFR
jgi:hypothetical protein